MAQWFTSDPISFGIVTFILMWIDWILTVLQERERRTHYGEHYQSYPLNTIEGHPGFQSAVSKARIVDGKHIILSLVVSVVVSFTIAYLPDQWREVFLGYVWGLYFIVDTTHVGNLIGYRVSRRGLHGKQYIHQRTGYLVQMGRYAALTALLLVLAVCSASLFIGGVAIAGMSSTLRQFIFLKRVPAIPEDDPPPYQVLKLTELAS